MQRRSFLRSGISAGILGVGSLSLTRQSAVAAARQGDDTIRLSSNENPLGISPLARQAIEEGIAQANRYPRLRSELMNAIAAREQVRPENVVLGAGSTEVLKMAVQRFATPGGHLILADPTYEDAGFYAGSMDLEMHRVPLRADMTHDLGAMRSLSESVSGPVCVYVCNPNNPTGTLTPCSLVDEWIESASDRVHFLVDEAYFDFVQAPEYWTAIKWITEHRNVLVARTFSKVYGMAGIRLGYGIAHPETARELRRLNVRNNANHFASVAALASLRDQEFYERSLRVNERGKEILYACLRELDLEFFRSHTNFVMHRIGSDLRTYNAAMGERGIRVGRPFPPMLGYSRLSIGLPAEMERFTETLRAFRREGRV
ncbi:MAG: aminotransferase class I/II-fold pyridoxal phosphate-dependent enzyme [Gemmatimonadales bacterium]|jgi:histidinol-phosphate aminotransferase